MNAPLAPPAPATSATGAAASGGLRRRVSAFAIGAVGLVVSYGGLIIAGGGLGLSPIMGVGAIFAIVALAAGFGWRLFAPLARPSPVLLAWAVFAVWAGLTWLWSPYPSPDHAAAIPPTLIGAVALCALFATVAGRARRRLQMITVLVSVSAAFIIVCELLFDLHLTEIYRVGRPVEELLRNLGHAVSAQIVFLPAALALLWGRGTATTVTGVAIVLAAVAGAIAFGLASNVLGLLAGFGFAAIAAWRVKTGVWAAGIAAAASLLFAPLLGIVSGLVPQSVLEQLPFTWGQRLMIWDYAARSLPDAWLFGHGFDAARTVEDTLVLKDFEFAALPLHPHNFGLQLWYEIGFVGVALAAAAIILGVRRIARAPGLSRVQGIAAAGFIGAYAAMSAVSYGVWQEWWLAAAILGGASLLLIGPARRAAAP